MEFINNLTKDTIIMTLFGGVFVLISFVFIYFLVSNVRRDIVSQQWPKAFGKLQDIEIVRHERRDRDETHRVHVSYAYVLTYEYEVDKTPYTVKRSESASNREEAVEESKRHHIGESTSVYYDPNEPSESRTQLESPWRNWLWFVGFLAFAGFGGGIIYIGFEFY